MSVIDNFKQYCPDSRADWRNWLNKNSDLPGAWLIFFKKSSNKITLSYDDAVEEALCFGWIDSLPRKLDEERHMLLFTPRKKGSPWSRINKNRVEKILKEKIITEKGLEKIDQSKEDGSWEIYDEIEDLIIPKDLEKELKKYDAITNFKKFNDSSKKGILWWIKSAKSDATRNSRVETTAQMAAKNLRAIYDKDK